ncbi:MAG: 5'/3'-nucleotidase SurE [Bacteroidales bacterium]|jgi:5'-nucleotidase|nr:5'/3'-nucleotidase SurE [Bacteroidales bacterium]
MGKPIILITNDDSISAPGIHNLIKSVLGLGKIYVVAPDRPQSGQGHAFTTETPLRLHLIKEEEDYIEYSCSGTPADCVKLGCQMVLKRKPDLLLSGVNHGSNASVNAIYSGTMAAVIEGCMMEVPSVGFSLDAHSWDSDMSHIHSYIRQITEEVIKNGLPNYVCLNVNFPKKSEESIKGVQVCRQGLGEWFEDFDERIDPQKRKYYWIKGRYEYKDPDPGTDILALRENYISIVPTMFDWTAKEALNSFKQRFENV